MGEGVGRGEVEWGGKVSGMEWSSVVMSGVGEQTVNIVFFFTFKMDLENFR